MRLKTGIDKFEHAYFLGQLRIARILIICHYSIAYQPVTHQRLAVHHQLLIGGEEPQLFPGFQEAEKTLRELIGRDFAVLRKQKSQIESAQYYEIPKDYVPAGESPTDWVVVDAKPWNPDKEPYPIPTFEGSRAQFSDSFFSNATNEQITYWAESQGHCLLINGRPVGSAKA